MNIQFPLIIVFVKHVLRNNHYRNTVLVFTPEITTNLKVISATTRVILATNKLVLATEKSYLSHYKVILATEEVITATLKNI